MRSIVRSPGHDKLRHQPSLRAEDAHAASLRDEHGTIGIDVKPTGIQATRPLSQETAGVIEELEAVVRFAIGNGDPLVGGDEDIVWQRKLARLRPFSAPGVFPGSARGKAVYELLSVAVAYENFTGVSLDRPRRHIEWLARCTAFARGSKGLKHLPIGCADTHAVIAAIRNK